MAKSGFTVVSYVKFIIANGKEAVDSKLTASVFIYPNDKNLQTND